MLPQEDIAMLPTQNDMPAELRGKVCVLLSASLADAIDLGLCAKAAHWNVRGPNFIALHKLFDELAADSAEYADLLAERIKALGGMADGSHQRIASTSRLPAYPSAATSGAEHVEAISTALGLFGTQLRAGIDACMELGDNGSADLFTELSRAVDKWLWFVESHGQQEALIAASAS
jgi:starvation-inducible DNA-binding protein